MDFVSLLIAGTAGAAIFTALGNIIQWILGRVGKKADTKVLTVQQMGKKINTIEKGQRVILHDRIKYLARCYIEQGEVKYDDYKDLVDMHDVYSELGGENLVRPVADVSKLKMTY